jgi:SAM-dependent methyltransferase
MAFQRDSSTSRFEWEEAERKRSAVDSAGRGQLLIGNVQRYLSPPPDSPYPLEYSFHLLGNCENKTVLDYGCGAGENCVLLSKRGCNVIGLDISPELIKLAQQRMTAHGINSGYDLRVASGYESGLKDHSVDGVFAIAILHHLDLEKATKEIRRILKPGGFLIVQEPLRDSSIARLVRKIFPAKGDDISPYEYPLTSAQLERITNGMDILSIRKSWLPHTKFFMGLRR